MTRLPLYPFLVLLFLRPILSAAAAAAAAADSGAWNWGAAPSHIQLRAAVLHALPFADVQEQEVDSNETVTYTGFQPDLLERMKIFAADDNVTLDFILSQSPPQYGPALDLVANDCNTTGNPNRWEDCQAFDLIVGNYYATPQRALRVDLSPAWLRATISTVKYIGDADATKTRKKKDYTTLTEASEDQETVCLKDGTFYAGVVKAKFPGVTYLMCPTQDDCLNLLKDEQCVLYPDDELQLRYRAAWDPTLEVTREQFNTQYIVWPMSFRLPPVVSLLVKKWMYDAVTNATLDELYFKYFQKELCPVGTAGENCELPCNPIHGEADARGVCVCASTKWTGDDCSIEVPENTNGIPKTLRYLAFCMVGINVAIIVACGVWLVWKRETTQVRVSQPSFLMLVLLGCLISTSTIIALAEEDDGHGTVKACMFIPWLYSVGFSVTFGTLFAKIRRVFVIFKSAADMRRSVVTVQETLVVIGGVLIVDLSILIAWTVMDPLEWRRTTISADQFGVPLETEGFCTSDHWMAFAGAIAALHLTLLGVACYMCYVSRGIPTKFSEGKYVSIAMISNLQIFVVGVPILIILGTDSQTSFFVRSVVVWMNDFVVVTLIFGNLIYSVHVDPDGTNEETVKAAVGSAILQYTSQRDRHNSLSRLSSMGSRLDLSAELSATFQGQQNNATNVPQCYERRNNRQHAQEDSPSKDHCTLSKNSPDALQNRTSWALFNVSSFENVVYEVSGEDASSRRELNSRAPSEAEQENILEADCELAQIPECHDVLAEVPQLPTKNEIGTCTIASATPVADQVHQLLASESKRKDSDTEEGTVGTNGTGSVVPEAESFLASRQAPGAHVDC